MVNWFGRGRGIGTSCSTFRCPRRGRSSENKKRWPSRRGRPVQIFAISESRYRSPGLFFRSFLLLDRPSPPPPPPAIAALAARRKLSARMLSARLLRFAVPLDILPTYSAYIATTRFYYFSSTRTLEIAPFLPCLLIGNWVPTQFGRVCEYLEKIKLF